MREIYKEIHKRNKKASYKKNTRTWRIYKRHVSNKSDRKAFYVRITILEKMNKLNKYWSERSVCAALGLQAET